jgi:hypothetical protein
MDKNWYVVSFDNNYDEYDVVDSEFDTLSEYVIVGSFTSEVEAKTYANKLNNHEIQPCISDFDRSF